MKGLLYYNSSNLDMMRKLNWRTVIWILILIALLGSAFFWLPSVYHFLSDRPRIEAFLNPLGFWAPLGLIAIQALQVALFPVPGLFGMLGGFIFGFLPGLIYSQIGTVLGSILAFFLAKVFGRPLVEKIVPREKLEKVDSLARNRGTLFFLIYYWVPYVPKDAMCYVAGLTPMGYWNYLVISFLGRLPGTIGATLVGAGIWQFQIPLWGWIILGFLIAVILSLGILYRDALKKWVLGALEKNWK